jgi:aspartate/methionine/tyrosine aminotransferase
MTLDPAKAPGGWVLDLEQLAAAVTQRTRAIIVNSPANPTGWTATREELSFILDLSRKHGLWIIADEIYGRFVFGGAPGRPALALSFHDIMEPEDRILFVQTFSKNWAMTGWRLGWLEASPALGQVIENLIQYQISGTPVFVQRGGVAALDDGEAFVAHQIERARKGRDIVNRLTETGLVDLPPPSGAFYAFLRVKGAADSREIATRLIDNANVGLAPGTAFGESGEGYLRLCYARNPQILEEAVARISAALPGLVS